VFKKQFKWDLILGQFHIKFLMVNEKFWKMHCLLYQSNKTKNHCVQQNTKSKKVWKAERKNKLIHFVQEKGGNWHFLNTNAQIFVQWIWSNSDWDAFSKKQLW